MSSYRGEPVAAAVCALLALVVAVGCSTETSQLVVVIDTNLMTDVEPPVAGDGVLRSVRVEVCDESCDDASSPRTERVWTVTRVADSARVSLPFSFGVAPFDDDPSRRVDIRVEARRRADIDGVDATLFAVRRRVEFVRGQSVRVPIFLSAQCIGIECPPGTTCNAVGECEPEDVLPSEDAGVSGDGGVDVDGGPPAGCDVPPAPSPFPGLELADAFDLGAGPSWSSTAVASGSSDTLLVAGRGGSELFVRRVGASGAVVWETPISHDATSLWFGQVRYLAERDGHVVAAGIIGEGWNIDGMTVPAPAPAHNETDSRRHGIVVFSVDAITGDPEWVHVIKRQGVTHIAGGLVVDDAGIAVASYAIGGTVGQLELDGAPWPASSVPPRGVPAPRATLFRFGHDGSPRSVLGVTDDPPVMDVAIASAGEGDLVFAVTSQGARAAGLDVSVPDGDVIVARLGPEDDALWVRSIRCEAGSWQVGSVKSAVDAGRSWLAFTATSRDSCSIMRVSSPEGSMLFDRPGGGDDFLGAIALDACTGAPLAESVWAVSVPSSPYFAVTSVAADERGLVIGGALGNGGVDFGGGFRPGMDTGGGTDGFVLGLDVDGDHAFSYLFGGTNAGVGPDDGVESVIVRADTVSAAGGLSGEHSVDGVSVPAGASLLVFEAP